MIYSTLLGGTGFDDGRAITVDLNGRAHLTGVTDSPDFPTTADAVDRTLHGVHDAFVTTVNAAGTRVRHSTFLGGAEDVTVEMQGELGSGIAVDRTGGVYVIGDTDAADFPTTRRAFATSLTGFRDAFVTKLDPDLDDGDEDVR